MRTLVATAVIYQLKNVPSQPWVRRAEAARQHREVPRCKTVHGAIDHSSSAVG